MTECYVYILASRPGGAIYIGVTNDLVRRVYEYKSGAVPGFTKRYGIARLVYFEAYPDVRNALQREKNMKHWPRAYKTRLIVQDNPTWRDLYTRSLVARPCPPKRDGRDKPGHDR
jgi:putative endonuclease